MATTSIEWTRGDDGKSGVAWNPVTGCDKVSDGCSNCYAMKMSKRLKLTPISAQRVGRKIERAGWSGLDPLCPVEWADSTFSHQGFSRRY